MREIDYYELGATLYIPILHKNLEDILSRRKYLYIKSVVICLEDSTPLCDIPEGMSRLKEILENFSINSLKVFIRPRDIYNLKDILEFKNIEMVDGFALAKFGTVNISEYLSIFIKQNDFYIMPILESVDVFDNSKLQIISRELEPFRDRVLTIRVGGEDILSMLDMMRDSSDTLYQIMPIYMVLSNIINVFRPNGFHISSVVYSSFSNIEVLEDELMEDIKHNLFNKTSIHPKQIEIIHKSYRVSSDDYEIAKNLLTTSKAIISINGRMYEKSTHSNWAKSIIKRYENYGYSDE